MRYGSGAFRKYWHHLAIQFIDEGRRRVTLPLLKIASANDDLPEATSVLDQLRTEPDCVPCRCKRFINKQLRGHAKCLLHTHWPTCPTIQARPCTHRHLALLGTSGSHISTSPRPVTESKSSPYNSKFGASDTSRADSGSRLFQIVAQVLRIVEM